MKTKSKKQNVALKLVASLLFVPAFVGVFLNMFSVIGKALGFTGSSDYPMFAEYPLFEQPGWMLASNIAVVVSLVLAGIYILLTILQLCNVKMPSSINKFMKLLGILIILSLLVVIVCGIVAVCVNKIEIENVSFSWGVGLYLQLPTLLGGILAATTK